MLTKEEVLFQQPPVSFGAVSSVKSHAVNGLKEIKVNAIGINNNDLVKTKSAEPCYKYVHSKVTLYYNSRIELKWRRSLHYCQTCENGDEKGLKVPCGSIHYGMCLPVSAEVAQRLSPKVPAAIKKLPKHSSHLTGYDAGYDAVYPQISSSNHPSTVQVNTEQQIIGAYLMIRPFYFNFLVYGSSDPNFCILEKKLKFYF